ncbi:MAG: hypothetical protein R6U57_02690 [Anaerolineales bacterium]
MVEETTEQDIGFALKEERKGERPGFHRLDIILSDKTEGPLHKVEAVELRVLSPATKQNATEVSKMTVGSQWNQEKEYKVVPGRVNLVSEEGKKLEFFTFGGDLNIRGGKKTTHCTLRSPAPIYSITEMESVTTVFIDEVEIMLAEEHAKWGDDDQNFWNHIAQIPPQTCYASCLVTLREKLEHNGYKRIQQAQELKRFLKQEIEYLGMEDVPQLSPLMEKE